ncbi:hypothetical protein AMTRI_Chr04g186610 [Amborella trichopoda]
MDHLMSSIFMMELYYIVAILSAIVVPEVSVASPSPSSGSSKDGLQLLSFKGMDHQEIVDLLICNSSPSKPNETSMKASPWIPKNIVSGCLSLNLTRGICQVKVLTLRVQPWYLVMEIEHPLPQD